MKVGYFYKRKAEYLPLFPADYLYHRAAVYNYDGSLRPGIHWRVGLILPIVAFSVLARARLSSMSSSCVIGCE